MTNSRASKEAVLLETYIAAGAEATHTFLTTSQLFTRFKHFILEITLEATAAFVLYAKWNENVAAYDTRSIEIAGTTVQAYTSLAGSACAICGNTVCATNGKVHATVKFSINQGTISAKTDAYLVGTQVMQTGTMEHSDSSETFLQNLIITPSTSTWKTGTKFQLFGILAT